MRTLQALILLGGKGTRIQGLFDDRPKCLVPLLGKPFLLWQLEWLREGGVRRVHLAAGHMADILQKWLADHSLSDMEITISVEPKPLGTGGAIKFVEPWICSDPFLVLNGDSLAPNLDFGSLLRAYHQSEESSITIAVSEIAKTGRYGTVEFDASNRVTAFLEKTERERGWINTGVYCMGRGRLSSIPSDVKVSIETDLFPKLVNKGELMAFPIAPPLLDMGTPQGLEEMTDYLGIHSFATKSAQVNDEV